ncbi:amidohydrolase family protein [Pseudomonas sp. NPDC087814]|uniref:amidohydrolase family protein n=1 Tax=Pseudomonas sp. NPDC087814 TaxID=3364450 RepID=UPI00380BE2DC
MNRREFVARTSLLAGATVLGAGVVGGSLPRTAAAQSEVRSESAATKEELKAECIDVHHNILPPVFVDALQRRGLGALTGTALPSWSVQQSVALMDAQGIQTAITSLPAPGVCFGEGRAAADLARSCNEFAADMAVTYPGRFGSFAILPLPATDLACAEAIYALDTLQADGVLLMGSSNGVFLGDPQFEELMSELNQRQATVFLQANLHPSSAQLGLGTPPYALEMACDITRAAINLIFTGTMERYPRIRWILADGGGFLPYAAWRISLANALPEFADDVPLGVMSYLRRFYFDTAVSTSPASMAVIKELVEPAQVVFGSGYPIAPAASVGAEIQTLRQSPVWGAKELRGITRGHALSLFPHYAEKGEWLTLAPVHESESSLQWWGRTLKKPLGALAQHLKDQ